MSDEQLIKWTGDAMEFAKAHVALGRLTIDPDGRIWRVAELRAGKCVSVPPRRAENVGGKGYLRVSLGVPGERRLAIVMAHRLVYECAVGPIGAMMQINHKDLNKQNNALDNLEVVTGTDNIRHSHANGRVLPWSYATKWRGREVISDEKKALAVAMRKGGSLLREIASELDMSIAYAHLIVGANG